MGQIGRFIDHCCEHHPQLMRAVLEKPLAPLGSWITWDDQGRVCGCLIGTAALAAGFQAQGRVRPGGLPVNIEDAFEIVSVVTERTRDEISDIGMAVYYVSAWLSGENDDYGQTNTEASDARTVHLLRQRIARQLAIRESALGITHALPHEPVEPSVKVTQ